MEWISEKFVEDCIAESPQCFLGRPLNLLHQQPRIAGFVPDLIFEEEGGQIVIVEVQLHALDRNHLYRCLEYRDSLMGDGKTTSVILVCESLPQRYERIAKTHGVDVVTVERRQLIRSAIGNCPNSLANHLTAAYGEPEDNKLFSVDTQLRPYAWHEYDKLIDVYRYTIAELARCGLLEKYRNDRQTSEIIHAAEDFLSTARGQLIDPRAWNIDSLVGPPGLPPEKWSSLK